MEMTKDEDRQYREVFVEMADKTLALASLVAANAVKRGVSYRLACHAIKVALYQGLFAATLRELKNERKLPTSLSLDHAYTHADTHEPVAHEMLSLIVTSLECADRRQTWRANIVRRPRKT